MEKFAMIKDGMICNIILAEQNWVDAQTDVEIVPYISGEIGDLYEDGIIIPVEKPVFVPHEITALQFRKALSQEGLLTTIQTLIDQNGTEEMKLAWQYAAIFKRDDELLKQATQTLGYDENVVDNIFRMAGEL